MEIPKINQLGQVVNTALANSEIEAGSIQILNGVIDHHRSVRAVETEQSSRILKLRFELISKCNLSKIPSISTSANPAKT
jgi:hypothetical protein